MSFTEWCRYIFETLREAHDYAKYERKVDKEYNKKQKELNKQNKNKK